MDKQLNLYFLDKKYDNEKIAKTYIKFIEDDNIPAAVRQKCLDVVRDSVNSQNESDSDAKIKLLLPEQSMERLKPISALIALMDSFDAQGKIRDGEFTDITVVDEWEKSARKVLLLNKKKE